LSVISNSKNRKKEQKKRMDSRFRGNDKKEKEKEPIAKM